MRRPPSKARAYLPVLSDDAFARLWGSLGNGAPTTVHLPGEWSHCHMTRSGTAGLRMVSLTIPTVMFLKDLDEAGVKDLLASTGDARYPGGSLFPKSLPGRDGFHPLWKVLCGTFSHVDSDPCFPWQDGSRRFTARVLPGVPPGVSPRYPGGTFLFARVYLGSDRIARTLEVRESPVLTVEQMRSFRAIGPTGEPFPDGPDAPPHFFPTAFWSVHDAVQISTVDTLNFLTLREVEAALDQNTGLMIGVEMLTSTSPSRFPFVMELLPLVGADPLLLPDSEMTVPELHRMVDPSLRDTLPLFLLCE